MTDHDVSDSDAPEPSDPSSPQLAEPAEPAEPAVLSAPPRLIPDAPLGGDEDEWGEQAGAVAFVPIAAFPDHDEATMVARHLVENGIGATVVEAEPDHLEDLDDRFAVHVLPEDRRRAAEVLGLVEAELQPLANPEEAMKLDKTGVPWKVVLPIFAAAMILVPLAAGYLTYLVMSR